MMEVRSRSLAYGHPIRVSSTRRRRQTTKPTGCLAMPIYMMNFAAAHVDKRLHSRRRSKRSTASEDQRCQRPKALVRAVGPYGLFIAYCACGGVLFYYIEQKLEPSYDHRAKDKNKCIGGHEFWAAFFYVISACSTIGFGTIYACTTPTRILSVLYSIIGIPLVLIILADIGKRMCRMIRLVYVPLYQHYQDSQLGRRKDSTTDVNDNGIVLKSLMDTTAPTIAVGSSTPKLTKLRIDSDESSEEATEEIPDIPISLGVILTLACVLLCALYYHKIENYAVGESIYYSFLTFVAGDFNTNKFKYAVPVYSLIFLGFSMLSLTISIIQNNIDNLINRVKREVRKELQRQVMIREGVAEASGSGEGAAEQVQNSDDLINGILKKHGASWLVNMIPQKQMENISHEVKEVINVSHVDVQTDAIVPSEPVTYADACMNCVPIYTSDAATNSQTAQLTDAQVDATAPTKQGHSQTPKRVFNPGACQTLPKLVRDGQMQTLPKLWASNEVQAKPDQKHQASNSIRPRCANRGVTAAPQTRTILMQFPKAKQ